MGGGEGFTRREWFTVSAIGSVHFFSAICISLQAPFYPQEAELKGATATEYGFVFGIFELVSFLSSPIFGKYIEKMGVKNTLNTGIVLAGVSSMMFGLLDLVPSHSGFISLSFLLRIVESLGASAAVTASFSITALVFPGSVATTFAALEIFYGLGYIIGPTIGGYLYQVGGFICPFMVMGGLLMLDGVYIFFVLPIFDLGDKNKKQGQIVTIWTLPPVILATCSVTISSLSLGFYAATLEPHIRSFNLSPVQTGAMFVINGGIYAVTAPMVGRLCDTRVNPKKMIALGTILILISFLLVGPVPYAPIDVTLWMCCLGLLVDGLGNACILIPSFIDIIRSVVAHGLPDDITTYGIISGIWASSFALGAFIGPSLSGFLFDMIGFRKGTLVPISLLIVLFIALCIFLYVEKRRSRKTGSESGLDMDASRCSLTEATGGCSSDLLPLNMPQANGYGTLKQNTTDTETMKWNT